LHLASPVASVVDMGSNLSAYVKDDLDKTTRPQANGFDIGADEFLSTGFTSDHYSITPEVSIFPNPSTNGKFTLHIQPQFSEQNMELRVYNVLGEEVTNPIYSTGNSLTEINLCSNPGGVYLLMINDGLKIFARRIVFQ